MERCEHFDRQRIARKMLEKVMICKSCNPEIVSILQVANNFLLSLLSHWLLNLVSGEFLCIKS